MAIIDADAHVVENEYTWEFMPDEDKPHKPAILVPKEGHQTRAGEYWFIDGRVFAKDVNVGLDTDPETREASDVKKRLAHMDELDVTTHVLYPTVFLRPLTRHPEVEVALARGYNRWVANIWKQGENRLRWVAIVPTSRMDIAIEELNWAKENGACGLFMRGIEGDYRPSDPYLEPLWAECQRLDLPVCYHAATGKFEFFDYFSRDSGFSTFKLPAVGAFHDIVMKQMHKKFPDLRWGFVEISASWVPYAMNDISIRYAKQGIPWAGRELLEERNIFVALQTADDIDYIVETAGEDNLVIGTDYGHNDTSTELRALTNLRDNGGLPPALAEKILDANPRRLYAL